MSETHSLTIEEVYERKLLDTNSIECLHHGQRYALLSLWRNMAGMYMGHVFGRTGQIMFDPQMRVIVYGSLPLLNDIDTELATLRQQLAESEAARVATEAERRLDLLHGVAMEVKYSRLYDATGGLAELLERAATMLDERASKVLHMGVGWEHFHDTALMIEELRAAVAKLKEAQS